MQNLMIQNTREKKEIIKALEKEYGFTKKLDYVFLRNKEDKIYIISRDIEKLDLNKLRINSIGSYFGELRNGEIRLSIEGAQIIGPKATKNVIELNEEKIEEWFKGFDVDYESDYKGFVIIKNNNDYYGSGKLKENKILNYIPKIRRLPHL